MNRAFAVICAGLIGISLSPGVAVAGREAIVCSASKVPDVTIEFGAMHRFGRTLDCISGKFVADLTPCAPNGAFALSAPTGDAAIVGIVDRWQDYGSHEGGVTSHYVTSDSIGFAGGFNFEGAGYKEAWKFEANRISGKGRLTTVGTAANASAKIVSGYRCQSEHQRF